MEELYYNPEAVEELSADLASALDTIKYLVDIQKQDNPDKKYFTPELKQAFNDLAGSCQEYVKTSKFYLSGRHAKINKIMDNALND